MTDYRIVIYLENEVVEYEIPKKAVKGIMMILDEAISSDATDWMSAVSER